MDFLKHLFEQGALTFEQFVAAVAGAKKEDGTPAIKIANLADGGYVDAHKFGNANTRITDLEGQLATRDADIIKLGKQLKDVEGAAETIKNLQDAYKTLEEKSKSTMAKATRDHQISLTLLEAGLTPKMVTAARALLNEETLGEDLKGLEGELTRLKTDYTEMFTSHVPAGTGAAGAGTGGSGSEVDFSKMTDAEYYQYMASQKK